MKWKHFPRYWPFVRGIHRCPVNSPHNGQWRGALTLSLICARINGWVNNGEAGDLRRHRVHYDVIVMITHILLVSSIGTEAIHNVRLMQLWRIWLNHYNILHAMSWRDYDFQTSVYPISINSSNSSDVFACYSVHWSDIFIHFVASYFAWPWWRHQREYFPCCYPFVMGIHQWPVNSPHKCQWRGALIFSLIFAWTNGRVAIKAPVIWDTISFITMSL